ncbi:MAG TPA: right-handed parallel beta-helix repeat-containing protein [Candidatus Saccharimonadales bacterium]|nr:right-handed parallel beta-helix repeat-containing protein [Candidatus Saccharimonadales bacterium]
MPTHRAQTHHRVMLPRRLLSISALLGILLLGTLLGPGSAVQGASPRTLYVDGKHGSDSNGGTSLSSAFKTVGKGMREVYREGVGRVADRLVIVGYKDYVYYETNTASVYLNGTSSNPVVIEAAGYGTSGYVRPIISGAKVVSRPGDTRWTRPDSSKYPDVWQIPWTTAIPGYDSAAHALRQERIFFDTSQPLIRPVARPTLAQLQATPGSQYWNGTKLYVHLGLWSGSLDSDDPRQHTIEIPTYKGLHVGSGSSYVTFRGLNIRHSHMAIGITGDAHHVTVQNVDMSYNYGMGIWTGSHHNVFRSISGKRNTIQLVKLDSGAQYNLIDGATATENLGQGVKLTGSTTAYNTIRNSTFADGKNVPMAAGQYGGYLQGVLIENGAHHNYIEDNTFRNMRRALYLYQTSSSGKSLSSNSVKRNLFLDSSVGVFIWDGRSGGSSSGSMTFSRNIYAGNGYAIEVEGKTSNKTFDHETIYDSRPASGLGAVYLKGSGGYVSLKNSIIRGSTAYGVRADSGSKLTISHSTVFQTASGPRSGTVSWSSTNKTTDPAFLSTSRSSGDYLTIGSSSPVYTAGSAGDPIGARAK